MRPKQFCPLLDGETLLDRPRRRVALAVEPDRTIVVVTGHHEAFYASVLADVPPGRLIVQPGSRGTGGPAASSSPGASPSATSESPSVATSTSVAITSSRKWPTARRASDHPVG